MEFGQIVQEAHKYEWIIFTSPNGVQAFFDMFFKLYKDAREIGGAKAGRHRSGHGEEAARVPPRRRLHAQKSRGRSRWSTNSSSPPAASKTRPSSGCVRKTRGKSSPPTLNKHGAIVDEAIAYRTVPETDDITGGQARFREEGADVITFASSSAVDNFMALGLPLPENLKIASIGPVTTTALKRHNLKPHIEAKQHDIPGLVEAIIEIRRRVTREKIQG